MTGKFGSLGSVAAALALAVFTGTAVAGNGNGNGNQPAAPGNSANAPGQVKKVAVAPAATQQQTPAAKPVQAAKPAKPAHGSSSSHSSGSTSQPGVKPSSTTAHGTKPTWTTVGANPDVSKRYGNGQTAAQIAKSRGAGADVTLYGPGNSQPHKVSVCGKANGHYVDVHAVKSYTNAACTTQAQQPSAQATETKVCGAVTTTSTATRVQRGHAYGRLKHGKPLHSKTVSVSVTLPTGEVCAVSGATVESVQQQVVQVLTQTLGTAPTQQQIAEATKTQSSPTAAKSGVLGATYSQQQAASKAASKPAAKSGRGGVLGAFTGAGRAAARGTLPFTGFPLWAAVLIGAGLIVAGLLLARRRGIRDTV